MLFHRKGHDTCNSCKPRARTVIRATKGKPVAYTLPTNHAVSKITIVHGFTQLLRSLRSRRRIEDKVHCETVYLQVRTERAHATAISFKRQRTTARFVLNFAWDNTNFHARVIGRWGARAWEKGCKNSIMNFWGKTCREALCFKECERLAENNRGGRNKAMGSCDRIIGNSYPRKYMSEISTYVRALI